MAVLSCYEHLKFQTNIEENVSFFVSVLLRHDRFALILSARINAYLCEISIIVSGDF